MSLAMPHQSAIDGAVRHLLTNCNPKGNRVGWLMLSSILVEAWDLYAGLLAFDPPIRRLNGRGQPSSPDVAARDGQRPVERQHRKIVQQGSNRRAKVAAELTNHLLEGVVLTPGAVATIPELQQVGFHYIK